jgi:hypothetical protein
VLQVSWLEIDQEVDIRVVTLIATGHRTKYTDVVSAPTARRCDDLVAISRADFL